MNKIQLLLIVILSLCLRLVMITRVPPAPSLDEVSIGYNAYSILKTGHDEFGKFMPILLRAYDDWRPAMYVYFVIPFVNIFGLNIFSVRMPSVILGVFTAVLIYLFTGFLINKPKEKTNLINWIPFISALMISISPWMIYQNRLGHEANISVPIFLFILIFWLKYNISLNKWHLIISLVFMALSLNSYQNMKIVMPLTALILAIVYRNLIFGNIKIFIVGVICSLIIALPVINASLTKEGLQRLTATSVFTGNSEYESRLNDYVKAKSSDDLISTFNNHPRKIQLEIIVKQYFQHFSPYWLFFGDEFESHKIPGTGLLYLWQLPLIIFGLLKIKSKSYNPQLIKILIGILVIAPIPGAITSQSPHAMRSNILVVPLSVLTGIGILEIYILLKNKYLKQAGILVFISIVIISVFSAMHNYLLKFPELQSKSFQSALQNALPDLVSASQKYQKVIVSNKDNLYQSYMFYLFYTKYDPFEYLKNGGTVSGGYESDHIIGNIEFRGITSKLLTSGQDYRFFGNEDDFRGIISKNEVNYDYLDGKIGIKALDIN